MRKSDKTFGDISGLDIFQVFELAKSLVKSHSDNDAIDLMASRMSTKQLKDAKMKVNHQAHGLDHMVGLEIESPERVLFNKIEQRIAYLGHRGLRLRVAIVGIGAGLIGGAATTALMGFGISNTMPKDAIVLEDGYLGLGLRSDPSILPMTGQKFVIPGIPDFVQYIDIEKWGQSNIDNTAIGSSDEFPINGSTGSGEVPFLIGGVIMGGACASVRAGTSRIPNRAQRYARKHEPELIDISPESIAGLGIDNF